MSSAEFFKKTIEKTVVDVFTVNGYKMRGRVVKVLDDMLVIKENDQCKCVMLSAISTVVPNNASQFEQSI